MDKIKINLQELLLCISKAQDLINPKLSNHHQQVAYLSFRLAEELNLPFTSQKEIFSAGLIHDIGALSESARLEIVETEALYMNRHAFNGAKLLEGFKPMQNEAGLIRYHHVHWNYGQGLFYNGNKVSLGSHIIHMADRTCLKIKPKQNILTQVPSILAYIDKDKDDIFEPSIVDALHKLSKKEYIWLDLISNNPVRKLPHGLFDNLFLNIDDIVDLSIIFSYIIDFRSKFTARHSAGVAHTAHKLAELMSFSPIECKMMLIAGYLHDLGKLAISDELLEKPSKLDQEEFNVMRSHTYYTYQLLKNIPQFETINQWASYHHERLNGNGYPFKIKGSDLSLGSRIMAVADIFTAITENRPYRQGMDDDSAIKILNNMVDNQSIDGNVVSVLIDNFQEINEIRKEAQNKASLTYNDFKIEKVSG